MAWSRREFLRNGFGFGISVPLLLTGCSSVLPALPSRRVPDEEIALEWLRLDGAGRFVFVSPRQEIGQGISIGLKQIIAEQLRIGPENIDLQLLRTDLISTISSTVGSESIIQCAEPLARAAAALRDRVIRLGATKLAVMPEEVELHASGVSAADRASSYRDLVAGQSIVLTPKDLEAAPIAGLLAADRTMRFVGASLPTDRIEDIVRGQPLFASDVRLPGMLYGAFARPPSLGSKMRGADGSGALRVAGVVDIVRADGRIGVVAETPAALEKGIAALEVEWELRETVRQDAIDLAMDVDADDGDLEHEIRGDDLEEDASFDVDLRIDIPMAAHMCMETRCAVAHWREGRIEVWSGTQDAFMTRDAIRKALGMASRNVVVHSCRVGGGFGGIGYWADVEAAHLSHAVGRPVKVQWTRSDTFQLAYHRPPSTHRIRVRVDQAGRMRGWWHRFKSGHVAFTSAGMPPWLQTATSVIPDFGVARGADPPYDADRVRVEFSDVRIPIDTGPWRGLGAGPNHFAVESAVDAAARFAGQDPVRFRLAHIPDPRLRRCLELAAQKASWRDGDANRGRGVACGIYKNMSYAAVIADVVLDRANRRFTLTRLHCTHDCGLVINPDQVRAQVEGNLVWGFGMVAKETLGVRDGRIDADHPGQYRIVTIADMPELDIHLVSNDHEPTGAGETAIVGAAAITNALAGLMGRPITRLPITTEMLEGA